MRLREVKASDLPGPVIVRTTDGTWGVLDANPPARGRNRRFDAWHERAFALDKDAFVWLPDDQDEDTPQTASP